MGSSAYLAWRSSSMTRVASERSALSEPRLLRSGHIREAQPLLFLGLIAAREIGPLSTCIAPTSPVGDPAGTK
jgi:hypothetical protein